MFDTAMSFEEVLKICVTVLVSLGGGGGIVFCLSSWLGKVWADRMMVAEKARHDQAIEALKAELQSKVDQNSQAYRYKLELYREAAAPIIDLLIEFQANPQIAHGQLINFERRRLNTTAHLGMFASDEVFNAYNDVYDYLLDALEGRRPYSFLEFRIIALRFLSAVRRDIGFHSGDLTYIGTR